MTPIALHHHNPHYFVFRGKPTVLIGSTEHYGAVLNLDFDYVRYLDELQTRGLNLTRTFSGVYREVPGSFNIRGNTLAPAAGRYLAPWARTSSPGAAGSGNRFDLQRWDEAYFHRLTDFVSQASRRGIVVEYVLFCPFYEEILWDIDPMNARNNVNGIGALKRTEVYTLQNGSLLAVQDAFVRKAVEALNGFDNVYFEICNEPYFGGASLEWQRHVADTFAAAERSLPAGHLIAQNIANNQARIENPNPLVSVFNFHYARPPDTVAINYHLNRPIGDDETGFDGSEDRPYRTEGWDFIVAGGAAYDNLDYSFTAGHERGDAPVSAPGGGGPTLRAQLGTLKRFIESFDFIRMAPDAKVIQGGVPEGATARALSEPDKQYAIYLKGGAQANLRLALSAGRYHAEWLNPRTGAIDRREDLEAAGGGVTAISPAYSEDIALRMHRR
jgi:hypothetical protein